MRNPLRIIREEILHWNEIKRFIDDLDNKEGFDSHGNPKITRMTKKQLDDAIRESEKENAKS